MCVLGYAYNHRTMKAEAGGLHLGYIVRSYLKKNLRGYKEVHMAQQIEAFILQALCLEFDLWNTCKGSLQSR